MQVAVKRAVSSALLVGFGVAAFATPSFHSSISKGIRAIEDDEDTISSIYKWSMPSVIQSGLVDRGFSFLVGDTYATYQGRSFELKHEQVKLGLADSFELFYGRQFILAKGRSSTSRLYDDCDYYGGRFMFKRPTGGDSSTASLQFETFRPNDAQLSVVTDGTVNRETLNATKTNIYSVNYGDKNALQYQLAYSTVDGSSGINAHSYSAGVGKDFVVGEDFRLRLQATLIDESFNGFGVGSSNQFKAIANASFAYNATPWLAIEADITAMPSGMPFVSGDFSGVSSFGIYEPGGIVNDLKSDFIAMASLRIMGHWKF